MTGPGGPEPDPSPARIVLPAGATDAHSLALGPAGGPAPSADAPADALFALHDAMGIDRGVIVQSGGHGAGAVAAAIAARRGRYLGVAYAPADLSDDGLARLRRQGFRGLRIDCMAHAGADADRLRACASRLADQGWHLEVHAEAGLIADLAPVLGDLPIPVVIAHMGGVDAAPGLNQAPFNALLRLMERPNLRVKVSGRAGATARGAPFAAKLVAEFPEQVLWGLDWPHRAGRGDPPDDGALVNLLPRIAPTDAALHRLLVDNPMQLYRFELGAAL